MVDSSHQMQNTWCIRDEELHNRRFGSRQYVLVSSRRSKAYECAGRIATPIWTQDLCRPALRVH
jgi:hypothetical protein